MTEIWTPGSQKHLYPWPPPRLTSSVVVQPLCCLSLVYTILVHVMDTSSENECCRFQTWQIGAVILSLDRFGLLMIILVVDQVSGVALWVERYTEVSVRYGACPRWSTHGSGVAHAMAFRKRRWTHKTQVSWMQTYCFHLVAFCQGYKTDTCCCFFSLRKCSSGANHRIFVWHCLAHCEIVKGTGEGGGRGVEAHYFLSNSLWLNHSNSKDII